MDDMRIRHRTIYRYNAPVALNPHRLLLRPRDGLAVHVRRCDLQTTPQASLSWAEDALGNAVATATFSSMADHLVIESDVDLAVSSPPWPVFDIAGSVIQHPFSYASADIRDLGSLIVSSYPDPNGVLANWARGFVASAPTNSLALLRDINFGIAGAFSYEAREPEGTQAPLETLENKRGSCRDFAVLFVEAVRSLGFAARLVSGYYHDRNASGPARSTHAWSEVFLPGAGWIAFDPTNAAMGSFNLVPVAIGADMDRIMPVSGSFTGPSGAYIGMTVEVYMSD
ncbi:transglutaminase family protein [Chthonobacter rhizosphaerae]|uniref:transglutaminase family protein n=1 Tax=Chthonobacter rhizosphaerae TaxID=2735553 RepID=UPI0015EF24AE|nr:transglutaminase family protein [Chthonobacter rhizosphaerae]